MEQAAAPFQRVVEFGFHFFSFFTIIFARIKKKSTANRLLNQYFYIRPTQQSASSFRPCVSNQFDNNIYDTLVVCRQGHHLCRLPLILIQHGIYGSTQTDARNLFRRGRAGGWLKRII